MTRFLNRLREIAVSSAVIAAMATAAWSAGSALTAVSDPQTVRIAAGALPPQMDRRGRGREAAIVRAALAEGGERRPVEFFVTPFTRHWEAFKRDRRIDAVITTPATMSMEGFVSDPYISYDNGIIYRRDQFPRGLTATPLEALKGKRVVAFAGAAGIIPGLVQAIPHFASYAEYQDQYVHSVMLARGYADAVIADRLIVDEYNRRVLEADYASQSAGLVFMPAFCPTIYHVVFRTDAQRNQFNTGLASLRRSGRLDDINAEYAARAKLAEVGPPAEGCRS